MKSILEVADSPLGIVASLLDKAPGIGKKISNWIKDDTNSSRYLGGSIANYANDLIMTFPMLIDNSLSPELCSMLSKASERNIVAMLHLLFSAMQFNGNDGKEIIKSIYGKYNKSMSIDDYIDAVDSYVNTSENYAPGYIDKERENNRAIVEMARKISECVKEGKIFLPAFEEDSINESSLDKYSVTQDYNGVVVKEIVSQKPAKEVAPKYYEPNFVQPSMPKVLPAMTATGEPIYNVRDYNDAEYKRWQIDQAKLKADADAMNNAVNRHAQDYSQQMEIINRRILDSDVKKANELQPTLMIVNYNETNDSNSVIMKKSFVCGVKSRLVPVESNDIIERIVSKNRTRLSFLNFIRATTKEIGFFRDFLFCLDQAKADARNSVKKGEAAQIWKSLEALSTKNNLNKMRRNGNDASAITTLVINKETANLMKKQFKIDIEQPRVAKALLDQYNLLAIYIVDESVEIVKTLYRGNQMYDQQAFSYLEREENDKSYKKVINLIGQMNR